MRRLIPLFAIALLPAPASLLACEGEAPIAMSPENPPGAAGPVASAAPVATESAPPPVVANPPAPCASSSAVAAAASAGVGSPEPSAPLPAATRGNLVGVVTAKPAALGAQAVVYLEDAPKDEAVTAPRPATISNRQMTFQPFLTVVEAGGKVVFTNADPFPHNVFSPDRERFNLGNIAQSGAASRVFKEPGAYSLLCNLHPGMLGYLVVTPSAFFARTDSKGHFVLKGVPVGPHRVTAWAPRNTPMTATVTVADGDVTLDFDLHR